MPALLKELDNAVGMVAIVVRTYEYVNRIGKRGAMKAARKSWRLPSIYQGRKTAALNEERITSSNIHSNKSVLHIRNKTAKRERIARSARLSSEPTEAPINAGRLISCGG